MFISRKITRRIILLFILILLAAGIYRFEAIERIIYPYPYRETVEKYSLENGVDPLLVLAVIREESHFMPKSSSHKGAIGLMQLMPNTAKEIAIWLGESYNETSLEEPEVNIRYGTWYLAQLQKQFSDNSILVLAAYNAGSGRVNSWLGIVDNKMNNFQIEDIPYKETREYVGKVLKSYRMYSKLYDDREYTIE